MKRLIAESSGEKVEIFELTFSEFMKIYRPKGYGTIEISGAGFDEEGIKPEGKVDVIKFSEVVCDFCNEEIKEKVMMKCEDCNGTGNADEAAGFTLDCAICAGKGCIESDEENKVYIDGSYAVCTSCFKKYYRITEVKTNENIVLE